ncbi:phosphoenolpyruvate carboxylase [Pseudomonas aeruginosa]|nr:phosphoenolpyruvate carboxylase [Pseudomonas aeruginosa]
MTVRRHARRHRRPARYRPTGRRAVHAAASPQLLAQVGDSAEPYRALLKQLRERLRVTRNWTHQALADSAGRGEASWSTAATWSSRCNCATSRCTPQHGRDRRWRVARLLRRAATFGTRFPVRLDVRQDSARHAAALSEITEYLELGSYDEWDEKTRLEFLLEELNSRRPLLPAHYQPSADTAEVLSPPAGRSPPRYRRRWSSLRDLDGRPAVRRAGGATCCSRKAASTGRCAWCRCSRPSTTWTTPAPAWSAC